MPKEQFVMLTKAPPSAAALLRDKVIIGFKFNFEEK